MLEDVLFIGGICAVIIGAGLLFSASYRAKWKRWLGIGK